MGSWDSKDRTKLKYHILITSKSDIFQFVCSICWVPGSTKHRKYWRKLKRLHLIVNKMWYVSIFFNLFNVWTWIQKIWNWKHHILFTIKWNFSIIFNNFQSFHAFDAGPQTIERIWKICLWSWESKDWQIEKLLHFLHSNHIQM